MTSTGRWRSRRPHRWRPGISTHPGGEPLSSCWSPGAGSARSGRQPRPRQRPRTRAAARAARTCVSSSAGAAASIWATASRRRIYQEGNIGPHEGRCGTSIPSAACGWSRSPSTGSGRDSRVRPIRNWRLVEGRHDQGAAQALLQSSPDEGAAGVAVDRKAAPRSAEDLDVKPEGGLSEMETRVYPDATSRSAPAERRRRRARADFASVAGGGRRERAGTKPLRRAPRTELNGRKGLRRALAKLERPPAGASSGAR